ncbi:MAG: hydantoinase B/oxoprolinase family protein [Proteobacteria bacterium]|nr:hydantoinase B/oxoprolinase family protein [Pseudomonadota bacterium]
MSKDFFTYEIVRSSLVALGDEMFSALKRAAMSPIIYETLDFAVGATDGRGLLICQGNGGTGFLGTLDAAVGFVLKRYSGRIFPGDIFMTNDPYEGGGTHLSDVTLVLPVFFDGELVAFVANKAHWTEVGGKSPGSFTSDATEIYQEGLQFPNIRLFSRGAIDEAIVDIIRANVRLPDQSLGDMWAQIAGLRVGERRLLDLFARYGRDIVLGAIDHLLDYGETMVRRAIKDLPKGTFEASDSIDDDGFGNGPFPVQVKVTITDDEFVIDYTGSHAQVPGPVNTPATGLRSRARAIFRAITAPDVPTNGGMFRPLRIICPPRTVFTAERPMPTSFYFESGGSCLDLVWKALAPHVPHRLPAGHFLSICSTTIAGQHPETGRLYVLSEPLLGGWGACRDKDGQNGQFSHSNGETFNIPAEITEARYGLRVDRYAFHADDGGAGAWRGGRGVMLDYRVLSEEAFLTINFSRSRTPPWGMAGGAVGSGNYAQILRKDGSVERFSVAARKRIAKGEVVRLVTSTGGGYGDPRARPREKVLEDLKNGYITPAQAAAHFGLDLAAE